ncbi:MAG: hypothetical protein CMP10_17295 [Zetaproteobacteria bacterium]|nr:hypothetical protein [Pseudobdellovibrionaceae bacterium]|tara:strand:- start:857 stop:1102 length:246 start_codon:yes stop_codon:yes gene_type:complete
MGKVLPFIKKETPDPAVAKLVQVADEIDSIILRNLEEKEVDLVDLAGLLSHRLGTLIRHIDRKDQLWYVCERVLKRQAKID